MARMGPLSGKERVMLGTFGLMLLLWANVPQMLFGPAFVLDPTVVAFLGLFVLIITDRKSTRLNSSHQIISYAVFCLKKKKTHNYHSYYIADYVRGTHGPGYCSASVGV